MNKKFIATTTLFTALASGTALACGDDTLAQWKSPDANAAPLSIDAASTKLKAEKGVIVEKSDLQSRCGPVEYTITDSDDGQILGQFPLPQNGDGRDIIVRTEQVLGASKNETKKTMARLDQARKDFYDDANALESEFGLETYHPNALPLPERFPNSSKQLVYVTTEQCIGRRYSSSEPLNDNTLLNTFEYIPGRTDYSEATIYQKGDLKKELLNNPTLRQALQERISENVLSCKRNESRLRNEPELRVKWALIGSRLQSENTAELSKGAYARYTRMFSPNNARIVEKASLRNSQAINITYEKNNYSYTLYMAGDVNDILRIEQDLARKGVHTDRESALDIRGEIEKEHKEIPAPLPVGP